MTHPQYKFRSFTKPEGQHENNLLFYISCKQHTLPPPIMKPGKTGTMTPPSKPDNGVFSSGAGPALPPRNDGTELVSVDLGSEGEINNCAFMSMRNFNLFWRVVSINHTPNQTHLRCRFAVYRVLGPHNVRTLHAQDVHVHDSTSTFQRASLSLSSLSPLTPLFVSKPHVFLPPHRHGISACWKY